MILYQSTRDSFANVDIRPVYMVYNSRRLAAGIFQKQEKSAVTEEMSGGHMVREESRPFSTQVSDEQVFVLRLEPCGFLLVSH